ncbi:MAG: hypothetical protein HZA61_12950 [Candidatus Eisenbacteria bacterium]|uniref:Fibronectin type-III domain-containing protein n=1 Tax=Eiseniibacteriota bacterium TaxID=2212470 RepID=A0A933SFK5_UNCEI|nr:hypothetical protein [Candidatus Eisenbacteria bacterium]
MRRLAAVLIAAALAAAALGSAGCSRRDRANPLDPANPETGGRPEGFNAVSNYSVISLAWTPRPDLAIDGFQLSRLAPGDSLYRPLGGTRATTSNGYVDSGVLNGRRYRYRLAYVVGGQAGQHAAEDEATAGALRAYVADPGAGAVVRLSPDGRDVITRWTSFGDVQSVAVDGEAGLVWVSSWADGLAGWLDPSTPFTLQVTGLSSPYTLAVDRGDNTVWICDRSGALVHRDLNGASASPGTIPLLDDPIGVAVGPSDRSVWVCEGGGNRVRRWNSVGTPVATAFLGASPSRVAVDSLTRVAWVTSLQGARVWRIAENGAVLDSSSACAGPIGIALDRPRGLAWVADAVGNRVVALDLATLAVVRTIGGFVEPRSVAVDPTTGEVWIVARGTRAVLRCASDGTVLDRLAGFADPSEIALDFGW